MIQPASFNLTPAILETVAISSVAVTTVNISQAILKPTRFFTEATWFLTHNRVSFLLNWFGFFSELLKYCTLQNRLDSLNRIDLGFFFLQSRLNLFYRTNLVFYWPSRFFWVSFFALLNKVRTRSWLAVFIFPSFVTVLPAVAGNSQLLQIDLSIILSATSLFWSKVVIKHYQKECVHLLVVNTIQKCKEKRKYSVCSTHSFYTSLLTGGYFPYYYC